MSKPTLAINKNDYETNPMATLGRPELLQYLIDSDLFKIEFHSEKIKTARHYRATLLYYNNKSVYFDLWEYQAPCYTDKIYGFNPDLIIKLQHAYKMLKLPYYHKACKRKQVLLDHPVEGRIEFLNKIVPWTFFPSRIMSEYLDKEDEIPTSEIKSLGFFCGKDWYARRHMKAALKEQGIEYIVSDQSFRKRRPCTDQEYIQKMAESKYGIIIPGRVSWFTEGKNRREIDYMMMRKPVLMSYNPYYYNELIPGKHYIPIDPNTKIAELEDKYDIEEIAENGYQWYRANASPMGAAKVFKQIMDERGF